MNTCKLFEKFSSNIKLSDAKRKTLAINRNALRDKIKKYYKDKGWGNPKFYSQGSFPLDTILNPIKKETDDGDVKEEYDLDDGIYFICTESDRKESSTYHNRIKEAVDGHAEKVIDKNTCVRVVYADGHHIDLPLYWLAENGDIPLLAHKSKNFIESDPKAFKDWVEDKISNVNGKGQLRRIIRYAKAWKNYRENSNSSLKLPSGFILTILVCKYYFQDSRDDFAVKATFEAIKAALSSSFTCYRPTVPTDEDLLEKFSKETVIKELEGFIDNAKKAINSDSEKDASEYWKKMFGSRFPLGEEKNQETAQSTTLQLRRTKVSALWASN